MNLVKYYHPRASRNWPLESLFEPLLERFLNAPTDSSRFPIRYIDKGDAYELRLEVPGYSKKEVNAEIDNNLLVISVIPKDSEEDGNENLKKRSFQLPEGIDSNKSKATLENGILTVTLTKKAARKPLRIKIG